MSVPDSPIVRYQNISEIVILPFDINFWNALQLIYEFVLPASTFLCDDRLGIDRLDLSKSTSRTA